MMLSNEPTNAERELNEYDSQNAVRLHSTKLDE